MRNVFPGIALSLAVTFAVEPARACIRGAPLNLEDIKYASIVVVGRVSNYEVVSPPARPRWRYARFNVLVDEVLVGQPDKTLTVTWNNSTFAEPTTMDEGPFLIGLRDPSSISPPLRGPSATVFPSPEPNTLTVLQAPCASAFIFENTSAEAKAVREILNEAPE